MAVAFSVALVATGCSTGGGTTSTETETVSAEWQEIIDAAKQEGSVIWYSTAPPAARELLVQAFQAKYPEISVDVRALSFADSEAALQTEHDTNTPGADVVSNVDYAWIYERVGQPGWMAEIQGNAYDAEDWVDSGLLVDDKLVTVPIGLVTIGWNTDLLPDGAELITGYDSLLDPKLGDGAIGIIDPSEVAVYADWWDFISDGSDQYLEDMVDQNPKFYPGAASMQPSLAAGEIAVGAFTTAADMQALVDQGAPVDFMVPDPAWVAQNIFWIPESAGHPNAAQLFMDFLGTEDGQAAIAKYGVTPLTAVQDQTLGGSTEIKIVNLENLLDPAWVSDYQSNWKEIWGR
ncbi:MAG: extracellular solute-binding protein [Protaetiibacter sp.]